MNQNKSIYKYFFKSDYRYGFITNIESNKSIKGINKNIIRFISNRKNEKFWILKVRLLSFYVWFNSSKPHWSSLLLPHINFQNIFYYSEPKKKISNIIDIPKNIIYTYKKLGVSINEKKILSEVAIDAVFDSVSLLTTYKKELNKYGIIFCSISNAIEKYSYFIKKYFASVVKYTDNFYVSLNTAVFSDGTFIYIPKNIKCPIDLSTYFRINEEKIGQFERTLIITDENSQVSYLEGCTAPIRNNNQLHAAVVELIALKGSTIKYSTVQNWYPGNKNGKGGVFNFVTKRGLCKEVKSRILWTQLETGSAITWKYPSCILKGNYSIGEFYSVTLTNYCQQVDTGTKMIHIGKYTNSIIISKGISSGNSNNVYRSLLKNIKYAKSINNYTQCHSLLLGNKSISSTIPYIEIKSNGSNIEHEAVSSKIKDKQLFYLLQRGISHKTSISLIINGFCSNILKNLPMEFALEAKTLLEISLEGSIG